MGDDHATPHLRLVHAWRYRHYMRRHNRRVCVRALADGHWIVALLTEVGDHERAYRSEAQALQVAAQVRAVCGEFWDQTVADGIRLGR